MSNPRFSKKNKIENLEISNCLFVKMSHFRNTVFLFLRFQKKRKVQNLMQPSHCFEKIVCVCQKYRWQNFLFSKKIRNTANGIPDLWCCLKTVTTALSSFLDLKKYCRAKLFIFSSLRA